MRQGRDPGQPGSFLADSFKPAPPRLMRLCCGPCAKRKDRNTAQPPGGEKRGYNVQTHKELDLGGSDINTIVKPLSSPPAFVSQYVNVTADTCKQSKMQKGNLKAWHRHHNLCGACAMAGHSASST